MTRIKLSIIACGDIHYRHTIPVNRSEDYTYLMERKLQYIIDNANDEVKNNTCITVFPGDIFNEYGQEPYEVTEAFANQLLTADPRILFLAVAGQHDQRYHIRNLKNTPIKLLSTTLNNFLVLQKQSFSVNNVTFYGVSFGQRIREATIVDNNKFRVLIAHKMIVKEDELFPGQKTVTASNMLRLYPSYNIIISGDNHQRFIETVRNRTLINMGSLMRMKTDQKEHQPGFVIIHILSDNTYECKEIDIPILPNEKVFVDKVKGKDEEELGNYRSLVEGLGEDANINYDYIAFLKKRLKKTDEQVKEFLLDCIKLIGKGK